MKIQFENALKNSREKAFKKSGIKGEDWNSFLTAEQVIDETFKMIRAELEKIK